MKVNKKTSIKNNKVSTTASTNPLSWKESLFFSLKVSAVLALIAIVILMTMQWQDNDLYWIIATGREQLKNGVLKINPFFNCGDIGFIAQQWLWNDIAAVFDKFNMLILLQLLQIALFIFISTTLLIYEGMKKSYAYILSISILPFLYCLHLRPELITQMLLIGQCIITEWYIEERQEGKKTQNTYLAFLGIMVLEINLHASMWILHFVMFLPYLVSIDFRKESKKAMFKDMVLTAFKRMKIFIVPALLMVIGMFTNPYDIKGITYLFDSLKAGIVTKLNISELQKPDLFSTYGLQLLITLIILIVVIILTILKYKKINEGKEKKTPLYFTEHICMILGLLFMCLFKVRYIYFFGVVAVHLFCLLKNLQNTKYEKIFNVIICIFAILAFAVAFNHTSKIKDFKHNTNYEEIVQYLDEHEEKDVKIFTDFNSGGYFEYKGYKTFFDARPELFSKVINEEYDYLDEYVKFMDATDSEFCNNFINKYNFKYYIVSNVNTRINTFLSDNDWTCVVKTSSASLYIKN